MDLNKREEELYTYGGEDRIISSHELAELLKNIPASPKISSGILSMDRILNNAEAGELVIVTGPTGQGKTTLLMTITKNLAEKEILSAWFTLEVTPRQFIEKISSHGTLPLFYLPAKNTENHVKWLIDRIIEAKVKYDVKVIFIDHLHQIFSIERMQGRSLSLEIGDIVAQIKKIAVDYGLVIFMVAHNTDDKVSTNREPKMLDIRDSGMISRLADVVMGVWRIPNEADGTEKRLGEINEDDNHAKVRIWKNRREGKVGWWLMEHQNHQLREIDMRYKENDAGYYPNE